MTKLSDAQALILSAAAQRPEHIALPLPESLRGGAAAKVVGAMLAKGFLEEVGPPLRFGQMPEHDHRRLGQPELRRGQHAPVACYQFAVLADEAGHGPAELGHAGGDLRDLVCAMHLRVFRVRLQAGNWPGFDPVW